MTIPRLLLVAGMPASGKSHFGRWLEAEHGFIHVDAELPGQLDRLGPGSHALWDASIQTKDAMQFAAAIRALGRPTVINWGFPVEYLPFIGLLKEAGFTVWWFDADVQAARVEYASAGRPEHNFDQQVADICTRRPLIEAVFAPNLLHVLGADGLRLAPTSILAAIAHAS